LQQNPFLGPIFKEQVQRIAVNGADDDRLFAPGVSGRVVLHRRRRRCRRRRFDGHDGYVSRAGGGHELGEDPSTLAIEIEPEPFSGFVPSRDLKLFARVGAADSGVLCAGPRPYIQVIVDGSHRSLGRGHLAAA